MIPDNNPDSTLHTRHALTLPSGTDVAADLLYDPGLSVVVLPAEIRQEIGDLVGVLQFPIIFAEQYASSPLTDALGVITQQAQCALQRFGASDWERHKTAERLVALKRISRLLIQEYGSAIQTVTCWSLQRVLSEHDFLEMFAADYATGKQHVNKTAVISIFDQLRRSVQENLASSQLAGILSGVAEVYSRRVANLIADLTFRVPLKRVIDTGWPSIEQTKQLESFSLIERCRQLAENFELKFDDPGEYDLTTIEQSLIQQNTVEISGARVDEVESLSSIEAPWRVSRNGSCALSGSELVGYPTGVAWLLEKAFTEAAIGGVIYPKTAQELSWLVNPWAESISESYSSAWSRAIVTDHILEQLFQQAERSTYNAECLNCPFEDISPSSCCGGDVCVHTDYLSRVRTDWAALCSAVSDYQV